RDGFDERMIGKFFDVGGMELHRQRIEERVIGDDAIAVLFERGANLGTMAWRDGYDDLLGGQAGGKRIGDPEIHVGVQRRGGSSESRSASERNTEQAGKRKTAVEDHAPQQSKRLAIPQP